jgi:uncharacterized membrane protein
MNRIRLLIKLHVLLMVVLAVYSIVGFIALPERYPVHFNFQGEPDRWAEKGSMEYWLLPLTAVVVGIGLLVLLKYPQAYNFPQKDRVRQWPPEKRTTVYNKLKEMMLAIAIGVDVVFLYVQYAILASAAGRMGMSVLGIFGPVLAMPVIVVYYLVQISRTVERTENELKISGWTPARP